MEKKNAPDAKHIAHVTPGKGEGTFRVTINSVMDVNVSTNDMPTYMMNSRHSIFIFKIPLNENRPPWEAMAEAVTGVVRLTRGTGFTVSDEYKVKKVAHVIMSRKEQPGNPAPPWKRNLPLFGKS